MPTNACSARDRPVPVGADRDQPTQGVPQLDRQGLGRDAGPRRAPGVTDQPWAGPPHDSKRVANSSFDAGIAPRPPAHTTMAPADHDACRTTSSGGRRPRGLRRSQEIGRRQQALDGVGEVGDDGSPFVAGEIPRRGEAILGLPDQTGQQRQRRRSRRRATVPRPRRCRGRQQSASTRSRLCHVTHRPPSTTAPRHRWMSARQHGAIGPPPSSIEIVGEHLASSVPATQLRPLPRGAELRAGSPGYRRHARVQTYPPLSSLGRRGTTVGLRNRIAQHRSVVVKASGAIRFTTSPSLFHTF